MVSLQSFSFVLSSDPLLRIAQVLLLFLGCIAVFLVFFTMRDVFLRSRSVLFQIACILLVALLPIVGFLFYLLIRPSRTVREKAVEEMLRSLVEEGRGTPPHSEKSAAKTGKKE